jgi:uncharacterized protein (DUF433 family)
MYKFIKVITVIRGVPMKVKEVIARINNGESITDIAKEFHVSRDTMNRRLKALGYEWNNSEKKRVYVGQNPEPDLEINEVIKGNNEVITGNQNGNPIITDNGDSIIGLKNPEGNKKVIEGNKERDKPNSIKGNNEVIKGNQNGNPIITDNDDSIIELKNPEGNKKVIEGNKERDKPNSIKGNNEVIKGNPFTDYEVMVLKEMAKHWGKGELEASASFETSHDIRELDLPLDIGKKVRKTFHISEEYIHKIDEFAKQNRCSKSDVLHLALFDFFNKK